MFKNKRLLLIHGVFAGAVSTAAPALAEVRWTELGDANWSGTQAGDLRADSGHGYLVSHKEYDNFRLKVEFFPGEGTNSGVFFRCGERDRITDASCYEANIFDDRPDRSGRTGAIVNVAEPLVDLFTEGQWNTYEIIARGSSLTVLLNGVVTVATVHEQLVRGAIALQFAQGQIHFRNFELELFPPTSLDQEIVGAWQLREFEYQYEDGRIEPWCPGAFGSIIYYANYMSVAINCRTDETKKIMYSGPYELRDAHVLHHVRNYSDSTLRGILKRQVIMPDRNQLELRGTLGDDGHVVVLWDRFY